VEIARGFERIMNVTLRPVDVPPGECHPHRWGALVVLCAAALIINLDNTIVALPTLVRDLHATSRQLQWIVDSYAMVSAGLLLVGGRLADRLGRKQFFLIGVAEAVPGRGREVCRVVVARPTEHMPT
jgi:hypothetical protein